MLKSDWNTDKYAAVPTLPALGGKLNSTMASLRSARGLSRSRTRRSTRAVSISVRSMQVNMSWLRGPVGKVQRLSQPVQVCPAGPGRPP